MMRSIASLALLPLLAAGGPALVPPAAAQEACTSWTAEMVEDEGGPVLSAFACATDRPDAYLSLSCFDNLYLSYDLATGAERSPDPGEETDVAFSVGGRTETLKLTYQEMDGRHAADLPVDAPLVQLLLSGGSLHVADVAGRYPAHDFSLAGAPEALEQLIEGCS